MPAPKSLSGLPKPLLFGLYGAAGGLLGALLFGELIMWLLGPKAAEAKTPPPEPRLAVGTPERVPVYPGGTATVEVQIARDAFDEPVAVRLSGLPDRVRATPDAVTIAKGATTAAFTLRADPGTAVGGSFPLKATATATAGGKEVSAESPPFALTPLAAPVPQADVVFVLDVTGSMQNQINGLQNGIGTFARDLERNKVDARFGCVAFRDLTADAPGLAMIPLRFDGAQFTSDPVAFAREVGTQRAGGGGDDPESSLEALAEASKYDFRKGAVRTLILITDADPKIVTGRGMTVKDASTALADSRVDLLHLVINEDGPNGRRGRPLYLEVQRGAVGVPAGGPDRGREFRLAEVAANENTFTSVLLPEMTKAITRAAEVKAAARPELEKQRAAAPELKTVKAVQSDVQYDAAASGQLVLAVGVWTGAIAALVCLFLLGGQHHYLRGALPAVGGAVAGAGGGLVVGLVGGAAGQGLFLLAPDSATLAVVFRVLGWTILGALAGAGLSLFIPNLKAVYGLAGGALGGAAGAVGYLAAEAVAGAVLGRLAGGLALGFCIGLMVAVVEAAFRSAWLEVRYSDREVITVNLGAEPVKVGGDAKACTVWARGAADVALRYFIRNGQVVCTDVPARAEEPVSDGDTRAAGNVTVVVRTGSSSAPAAARPAAPRRAAPPPLAASKPKPDLPPLLDLGDPDDGLPSSPPSNDPQPRRAGAGVDAPSPPPYDPQPRRAGAGVDGGAAPPAPKAPPPKPPVPSGGGVPPRPPVPPAPRTPSPPPPAAKPTARDPDACPTCGRKTPGRPGSRFCMVCDQTY